MEEPNTASALGVNSFGFSGDELKGALEALLFVTDEPVNVLTLADALQADPSTIETALLSLQEELLQANRGIQLRELAGGWRLVTHPVYHELLESYVASWDTRKLSQAALETLAIVAYCQPVTRNDISSIRGVSSDSSVNSLLEKGLLREMGVQDSPGNPLVYGTSKAFLEKFGLQHVSELPPLESFAPDEETKALIAERLRVVRASEEERAGNIQDFSDEKEPGHMIAEGVSFGREDNTAHARYDQGDDEAHLGYAEDETHARLVQEAMNSMMHDTLASTAGIVDKINFDELMFEEE